MQKRDLIITTFDENGVEVPYVFEPIKIIQTIEPVIKPKIFNIGEIVWVTCKISETRIQCRIVDRLNNMYKIIKVDVEWKDCVGENFMRCSLQQISKG